MICTGDGGLKILPSLVRWNRSWAAPFCPTVTAPLLPGEVVVRVSVLRLPGWVDVESVPECDLALPKSVSKSAPLPEVEVPEPPLRGDEVGAPPGLPPEVVGTLPDLPPVSDLEGEGVGEEERGAGVGVEVDGRGDDDGAG